MTLGEKFKIFNIVCILLIEPAFLAQSNKLGPKKLDECSRCKLLTDSYQHWVDKTSRGKHEGGDAAWEETKLKSYSRSEMRLVEIQENLCSEIKTHQEYCYALVEETEQLIEEWWARQEHKAVDLYHWLCIENLKYCCPPNHFGESCTPCALDKNNVICSGNGNCNGEGTRKGNGTCICHRGYSGIDCDECAVNFYKNIDVCKPCHPSCDKCVDEGPNNCVHCTKGWHMQLGVCLDINECLDLRTCKENEFCVNRQGSHVCKSCDKSCNTCIGTGPRNCSSCNFNGFLVIGTCVNKHFFLNIMIRIAFYFVLLFTTIITFKKSRTIASLLIIIASFLLYYLEKNSDNNLIEAFKHLLNKL